MEFSHIISETLLASVGLFTFIFLRKLIAIDSILWRTFILSVAFAALCAALHYVGFEEMGKINLVIKKISATAGILYLIVGIYSLVADKVLTKKVNYGFILLGIILSATCLAFNFQRLINIIPTIGIPIVFLLATWAIKKRNLKIGFYLLLAVLFSILANFLHLLNLPFDQVVNYCIVLASAIIRFGMARKSNIVNLQNKILKKTAL